LSELTKELESKASEGQDDQVCVHLDSMSLFVIMYLRFCSHNTNDL